LRISSIRARALLELPFDTLAERLQALFSEVSVSVLRTFVLLVGALLVVRR
jgi:hypothetical protein